MAETQRTKPMTRRSVLRVALLAATSTAGGALLAACQAPAAAPTTVPVVPTTAPTAAPTAAPTTATAPAAGATATSAPAATAAPTAVASPASKSAVAAEIVYLNQSRGQQKAMEELAAKYTSEFGIKVTIDTPGPAEYDRKLQAASQAGTMPDTFYAYGPGAMAPYIKAGWMLDLKPELDKGWNKNFRPVALDALEVRPGNALQLPPGIFNVSWDLSNWNHLYNTAHFEKAKLDPKAPPTTTQAFLDANRALSAAGIGAWGTASTYSPSFIQHYGTNWLSDEEINETYDGKRPWTSDGWLKAISIFVDLREANVIYNKSLVAPATEVDKSFFNIQELATQYTGTWSIPVQVTTAPDFTSYSAYPVPQAAGAPHQVRSQVGTGKSGAINPKGPHVEESLRYLKWLTEKEQQQHLMVTVPLVPTHPEALDPTRTIPQLAQFASKLDQYQKVWTPRSAPVTEALVKGVQSLLLREKTAEQVLEDAEKAQKA